MSLFHLVLGSFLPGLILLVWTVPTSLEGPVSPDQSSPRTRGSTVLRDHAAPEARQVPGGRLGREGRCSEQHTHIRTRAGISRVSHSGVPPRARAEGAHKPTFPNSPTGPMMPGAPVGAVRQGVSRPDRLPTVLRGPSGCPDLAAELGPPTPFREVFC